MMQLWSFTGCIPGGSVLQGLWLLILHGEPGELKEEVVHLLNVKKALSSWKERLALLKDSGLLSLIHHLL